jgi:Tfp pilus tip-associated adhesin PilY1
MKPDLSVKGSRFLAALAAGCVAVAAGIASAQSTFDPVNDDTDIFLANPAIDANRPNVLMFLDNTANWSRNVGGQAVFINEKSALVSVVNGLTDAYNVGLLMFPETGNPNDNVDGAYVRFAIRQMTQQNKSVFASLVGGLIQSGSGSDVGNNNTLSEGMVEAYRYYAGKASIATRGKVKSDYANNATHPATIAGLGEHALNSNAAGSLFNSPVSDGCQSNFIIYISNGTANENNASLGRAQAELSAVGYDTSSVIALSPNQQQGSWMDEWAKYLANADIRPDLPQTVNVFTYVVEVDPTETGTQGPAMTALMKSVALNGKGKYFAVSSGNAGQAIINALNQIFQEVQAVNSVFASTTLPVSVNVRGTNLNQVYIGVFRPDAVKAPRWYGNLKMYQLGFEQATNTLFLADASGVKAENPDTGFINPTASSYWTTASNFWAHRTAEENGPGGPSDSPDGDLVEKGGSAQQQRIAWANDQSERNLYTCTSGLVDGTSADCEPGSLLSATPFKSLNEGLSAAGLQLGTTAVSSLTGFHSQVVTALTDTKNVTSLSTSAGIPAVIDVLENGAVNKTVNNLTTSKSANIATLNNNAVVKTISAVARNSGSDKNPITATVDDHGYANGQIVHIAGIGSAVYNGTFTISNVTANTFQYSAISQPTANPTVTGATVTTTTINVTATTSTAHNFSAGDLVVVSGVTPSQWNSTYTVVNVPNATTFTFNTASQLAPATSVAGATAAGPSTTATATVPAHGYANGSKVRISGASPTGYNGVFTISNVTANTFQYTVASNLADATVAPPATSITANQGSTNVITAKAPGHGFGDGAIVTINITGANPIDFAGSHVISYVDDDIFTYTLPIRVPANLGTTMVGTSGTSTTATAIVAGHGFQAGESVIIAGVTGPDSDAADAYNGTRTIIDVIDSDTFTYSVAPAAPNPATTAGTMTARIASPTAIATVPDHGYATGNQVTVRGATPDAYNRSDVSVTIVDSNTFRYPLLTVTAQGDATGSVTVKKRSTTATVRAVLHGFNDGDSVAIAGASPGAFNGTWTITVVDANNFTYDLTQHGQSEQGDASGSISAASGSGDAGSRAELLSWVRGTDNFEDENANLSFTDIRASIHGDVLHSRPAVINYNRHGNDDDVYVFYGSNDGIFRAVKGGFAQSAAGEPLPGREAWGFIPEEFFSKLQRIRNNAPIISSSNKKPYFADGSIGTFVLDADRDGALGPTPDDPDAGADDKAYIYISMRRGGRFIYGLDVSEPLAPRLLWTRNNADPGWAELGQTWSLPRVVRLCLDTDNDTGTPCVDTQVLIFGAGYDALVEDVDPATITAVTDTTVVSSTSGTLTRSMGRGVFVVNAFTGEIIWQAGPAGSNPTGPGITHHFRSVAGMNYAIPSDITVIRDRNNTGLSAANRAYVGDTGGNLWRIDMRSERVSEWDVTKMAAVSDLNDPPGEIRKFLFPPDVVYSDDGYDAVLIGSGDREHPFDESVVNRFYMFKDTGVGTSAVRGTGIASGTTTLVEADLFDATSNCIQDADACTGDDTPDTAMSELASADGWFITLGAGEKVVGNAVTLNNVTFFNTNQPSAVSTGSCTSNLGIARQYKVLFSSAEALLDQNLDGSIDALDRATVHPGGGYLPSPVPVVVEIDGKTHEGIISGVAVDQPPGSLLNARLRKFWYKEME